MSCPERAQAGLRYDYAAVGHVTVDVLADGTRRPGGSALYAALQAARLGLRALIVTCGVVAEVQELLAPYRDEIDLEVRAAPHTTTLTASGWGRRRTQRMLEWAGPVPGPLALDAGVVHLAPIARELPEHIDTSGAGFVGLTPQGLVRRWAALGAEIGLAPPDPPALALAAGCDGVVVNERERDPCAPLIEAALGAGALATVTAGSRPVTVLVSGAPPAHVAIAPLQDPVDDIGAGDVFAAALFVALARGDEAGAAVRFASAAAAVRMAGQGPGAVGSAAAIAAVMSGG